VRNHPSPQVTASRDDTKNEKLQLLLLLLLLLPPPPLLLLLLPLSRCSED
jgi:hypothetical protein